jgi:MtN3 and saliva related transmembrane protein
MNLTELVGMAAAIITTSAWAPQAIKTIRSQQTRDISLVFQSMTALGIFLWLAYGILIGSVPLIFANIVTFIFVASILVVKIRKG